MSVFALQDLLSRLLPGGRVVVVTPDVATWREAIGSVPDSIRVDIRTPGEAENAASLYNAAPIDLLVVDGGTRRAADKLLVAWRSRVARDGGIVVLRGAALGDFDALVQVCSTRDAAGFLWCPVFGGDLLGEMALAHQCIGYQLPDYTEFESDDAGPPAAFLNPTPHFAMDDAFFAERLREIVFEKKITCLVETGTNQGKSTAAFAACVERVIGIDIDPECITVATLNCREAARENVRFIQGSSPVILDAILPGLPDETLYFLDAHWGEYWPLRDEILQIAKHKPGCGVIIIHDCRVPDRPFGYDQYGGRVCEYAYVADVLTVWSPSHRIEYNREAAGSGVGILYVFPGVTR